MAKDTAICTCCECGKEFEISFTRRSRSECDSYKEYLEHSNRTCKKCYAAEKERERAKVFAEFCAAFPLPEIDAVSDKQRDYAAALRRNYIADNKSTAEYVASILLVPDADWLAAGLAETGLEREEFLAQAFHNSGLDIPFKVLTETSARKIIDMFVR